MRLVLVLVSIGVKSEEFGYHARTLVGFKNMRKAIEGIKINSKVQIYTPQPVLGRLNSASLLRARVVSLPLFLQ